MKLEFNLPCKNYVGHYLRSKFGNPVYMRRDSDIWKYFYLLIEDASQEKDKRINLYESEIKVQITEDVFLKKGCVLTKTNIIVFNNFVETQLKTQINMYMDAIVEVNGIHIKKAVDYVYDRFDMDETIMPAETIVKQYYRHRNSLKPAIINK